MTHRERGGGGRGPEPGVPVSAVAASRGDPGIRRLVREWHGTSGFGHSSVRAALVRGLFQFG